MNAQKRKKKKRERCIQENPIPPKKTGGSKDKDVDSAAIGDNQNLNPKTSERSGKQGGRNVWKQRNKNVHANQQRKRRSRRSRKARRERVTVRISNERETTHNARVLPTEKGNHWKHIGSEMDSRRKMEGSCQVRS